jgi:hypothetical protein
MFLGESEDGGLDLGVVVPRHRREQMVLDLVVEVAREPVVEPTCM